MKKTITIILILFFLFLVPVSGYNCSYAASDPSTWYDVTSTEELAEAFRFYCKSRNLVIDGSIADALTSFTTQTFNNLCNTLGINITALQGDLKKTTDGNLGLRFLFNSSGIALYNRIFAEFLQNNDLAVGDTVDNKEIYSGYYYDGAFIWVLSGQAATVNQNGWTNYVLKEGSYYRYPSLMTFSSGDILSYPLFDYSATIGYVENNSSGNISEATGTYVVGYDNVNRFLSGSYKIVNTHVDINSSESILCSGGGGYAIFALVTENPAINGRGRWMFRISPWFKTNVPWENESINVTTNNYEINNNDYSREYTIIYNDGDYYEGDEYPDPDEEPGDPSDPDDDPTWRPVDPVIPPNDPGQGDNTIIDLPDIDIPDLPSLNFSLGDLRDKFPFSIPFDIIALLSVLDGEPQAPKIDAHIPFGDWYDWHFEADFSRFDDTAALVRSVEFIGFCIGLIYITILLVKG